VLQFSKVYAFDSLSSEDELYDTFKLDGGQLETSCKADVEVLIQVQ
jgi:hypothetical protein